MVGGSVPSLPYGTGESVSVACNLGPSPEYLPIAQNRREQGDIAVPCPHTSCTPAPHFEPRAYTPTLRGRQNDISHRLRVPRATGVSHAMRRLALRGPHDDDDDDDDEDASILRRESSRRRRGRRG